MTSGPRYREDFFTVDAPTTTALEGRVQAVEESVTTAMTTAQAAQTATTEHDLQILTIQNSVGNLTTNQTQLQGQVGQAQTDIGSLNASAAALGTSITSHQASFNSQVTTLQEQINNLAGMNVADLTDDINRVDGRITSVSNTSGLTRSVVESMLTALIHPSTTWSVGTGIYSIPPGEVSIIQAIKDRLDAVEANGGGVSADAEQRIATLEASLLTLGDADTEVKADLLALHGYLGLAQDRIATLESTTAGDTQRVSTLEASVSTLTTSDSIMQDKLLILPDLTDRVGVLEAFHRVVLTDFDNPPAVANPLRLWIDASKSGTFFTDTSMTTEITGDGVDVGLIRDHSGNDHHLTKYTGVSMKTGRVSVPGTTTRRTIHSVSNQNWYNYGGSGLFSDTHNTGGVIFIVLKTTDGSGAPLRISNSITPGTLRTNSHTYWPGEWMSSSDAGATWPAGGDRHLYIVRGDPLLGTTRVYGMSSISRTGQTYDPTPVFDTTYSTAILFERVMCGAWVGDVCEMKMYTGSMDDTEFEHQAKHLLFKWV